MATFFALLDFLEEKDKPIFKDKIIDTALLR